MIPPEKRVKLDQMIVDLIKELPPGAVKTWGHVEHLAHSSTEPIYLFVINIAGNNPVLQFKHPKQHLNVTPQAMMYNVTNETVAQSKFFNRSFLPTFFVFDNYMHCLGLEMKLKPAGYAVQYRKFE
jgi:hypothetical protein